LHNRSIICHIVLEEISRVIMRMFMHIHHVSCNLELPVLKKKIPYGLYPGCVRIRRHNLQD